MKETLTLANRLFQLRLCNYKDIILISNQIAAIISRHLSERPFHLNVIEAACHGKFKETGHSLVLANMLKHPDIQASFLKFFLGISHEYMDEVTPEKDRIDVALKGKDIFVIVENKVNGAKEERSQVYRYVHNIGEDTYNFKLPQIYVVYLNPADLTPPSDYSLCDENKENNVFKALNKSHYTVKSYKYDVTNWLRKISVGNEPHISSALDQYIDFLEQKFHTSPLDKKMNDEVRNFILKELHVEDKPYKEKIAALDNQLDKVEELENAINDLKAELRYKLMREWQSNVEQELNKKMDSDDHSFSIHLRDNVKLGVWDGYDEQNHNPYWGFELDEYKKGSVSELNSKIIGIVNTVGLDYKSDDNFPAWHSTQKGSEHFISLYRVAKEKGLL